MENLMQKDIEFEKRCIDDSAMMNVIIHQDGSVTKLLETLFDEAIEVECLGQDYTEVNRQDWNDIDDNEKILLRTIFLKGKETANRYVYATSLIRTNYLEDKIVHDILDGEKGIGELIQEYKLETFRELINSKSISNNIIRSVFPTEDNITSRVYKLYMKGIPLMLINEYYPHDLYRGFM